MSNFYRITVTHETAAGRTVTLVQAAGSLGLVSYAEREVRPVLLAAAPQLAGDVSATLVEVEELDGPDKRTVTSITADAETVALVLKTKLANERRDQQPTDTDNAGV